TSTSGSTTTAEPDVVLSGEAATQKLFRGIPQKLNVLGNLKAPVTMVEFADLQCPYCRDFAVQALPDIVRRYVRPGKVKLVFSGLAILGSDSERALRATYAAGLQGRLWNYLDLLALAGAAVAAYLVYARYTGTRLACTTGGCETVQHSKYAKTAGVPVAVLGLVAYLAVFATSLSARLEAAALGAAIVLAGLA